MSVANSMCVVCASQKNEISARLVNYQQICRSCQLASHQLARYMNWIVQFVWWTNLLKCKKDQSDLWIEHVEENSSLWLWYLSKLYWNKSIKKLHVKDSEINKALLMCLIWCIWLVDWVIAQMIDVTWCFCHWCWLYTANVEQNDIFCLLCIQKGALMLVVVSGGKYRRCPDTRQSLQIWKGGQSLRGVTHSVLV